MSIVLIIKSNWQLKIVDRVILFVWKSLKRLRELKTLFGEVDKTVPKPSGATGTRWIDHTYQAMKNVLENWGGYMTHIEFLTQRDF